MKKIFTLVAATAVTLAATAGTRVLYAQDFEAVNSAADAGWTYGGESMEIGTDEFGSFLQLNQGATNGRNAQVTWGDAIYGENASFLEDGKYTLSFDYCPKQSSNNQYNCGITVLTNLTPPANQPFTARWTYLKDAEGNNIEDMSLYQGYLFDLQQVQRETEETASICYQVNGNTADQITLDASWYTITLEVDVAARTVEYSIVDLMGAEITSGTRTVPATECDGTEISMYATGLWVMVARYQTQFLFDNFIISCYSSQDVANTPSVALTGLGVDAEGNLNLNYRAYTINFRTDEFLHILGTDGAETVVDYWDTDNGVYVYSTTTSGTLKAWTTYGTATSDVVEVEVDATPCVLPQANAEVVSVSEGYGKTYRLTVDNSNVLLTPTIFIAYEFVGDNGTVLTASELGTGAKLTVPESGTLKVTTAAFGYQANEVTVVNNIQYNVKKKFDFARLTDAEIAALGFAATDPLNSATTSGEQNWTARKRLFYYDINSATVNDEGETVYTQVFPFGYVSDADDAPMMKRSIMDADAMAAANGRVMEDVEAFLNGEGVYLQAKMLHGVGLIQDATTNNYNAVRFHNLDANDIIIINSINGYGSNSIHPYCATDAEYFAQLAGDDEAYVVGNVGDDDLGKKTAGAWKIAEPEAEGLFTLCWNLYRIDTALVMATVFSSNGAGIEGVAIDSINTDNAWYTIDGIRLEAPTHSGLYIHNGKKVIIRK